MLKHSRSSRLDYSNAVDFGVLIGWQGYQHLVESEKSKVYGRTVIDHALNPRNAGVMDDYSGYAAVTGTCGDTMEIWLCIKLGCLLRQIS